MIHTYYVLHLPDKKSLNRLIRYDIHFKKIIYQDTGCLLFVDDNNYHKLEKLIKLYNISLIRVEGKKKYLFLFKKYHIFIISVIVGIMFMYLLSRIIFDVEIMTNKEYLKEIILNELEKHDLKKYRFVKSFEEKEQIKKDILTNYKNQFEWIEIERNGSKYSVKLLERIIEQEETNNKYGHVVAKRNAVIKEIKATNGQIIKKVNDYVNRGDIIISGNIMKNDEVKNTVKAEGKIYGETWYNVSVELPRTYNKMIYTGNEYERFTLNIFDKRLFLFGKKDYVNYEYEDKLILDSKILPFSLSKTKVKETKLDSYFYTYQDAYLKGLNLAREKLLDSLSSDSQILLQKKLKLYEENSKIIVEVFFKVYEDITDYKNIVIEGE